MSLGDRDRVSASCAIVRESPDGIVMQRAWRLRYQRPKKSGFRFGIERHVEQQHRHGRPGRIGRAQGFGGGLEQRRPVARTGLAHQQFDTIEQFGQVWPTSRETAQPFAGGVCESQLEQRARECFRKSGCSRDR